MAGTGPTRRTVLAAAAAAGALAACGTSKRRDPAVTMLGAAGTFGSLTTTTPFMTEAVDGFGFGPGQSAYMTTVCGDGSVLIGTTPFTDDQVRPTGNDLELGIYEPGGRFTRLVIPTTTGRTDLGGLNPALRGIGGGDVADVVELPGGRAAFVVANPFQGWDALRYGQLPTLGRLVRTGGSWRYDAAASRTADQLAATMPDASFAPSAFPFRNQPGQPRDNRGTGALCRLPRSGHLVIAQYYGQASGTAGVRGEGDGALLVVDGTGRVRSWWQYPQVQVLGTQVRVHPREVTADPSSAAGDERFVLISDTTVPFTIQEFSYDAATGTVTPRSTAVRAAQDGSRMETAAFAPDGTLFVARTAADGLTARPVAIYPKTAGERGLVTRTPAQPGWATSSWGRTCEPDATVDTSAGGLVRSITVDPATGTALLTGISGLTQALARSGGGWRVTARVDIGLNGLRDGTRRQIGVRRGAVDARRRVLWLPCNQITSNDVPWPSAPVPLPQWLCRVDLAKLTD